VALVLAAGAVVGALGGLLFVALVAAFLFLRRRLGHRLTPFDLLVLGLCGLGVVAGLFLSARYVLSPEGLIEVTPPGTAPVLGGLFGTLLAGLVLWALRRAPR
jgi:hypothetical protein